MNGVKEGSPISVAVDTASPSTDTDTAKDTDTMKKVVDGSPVGDNDKTANSKNDAEQASERPSQLDVPSKTDRGESDDTPTPQAPVSNACGFKLGGEDDDEEEDDDDSGKTATEAPSSSSPSDSGSSENQKVVPSRFQVNRVEFSPEEVMIPDRPINDLESEELRDLVPHIDITIGSLGSESSDRTHSSLTYPHYTLGYNNQPTHHPGTFGQDTIEKIPHADHYRNLLSTTQALASRPTLSDLHDAMDPDKQGELESQDKHASPLLEHENSQAQPATEVKDDNKGGAIKFGWITGVLVRCLLNIWGVMLFLRLSWVVGQAGMGLTTVIILLSAVVTTITSLSMSAICTNGEVKGGGAYFMISRSLGPEFGGAIGLIFSMANAVAVAMYVVGFAETVRDMLVKYNSLMVDEVNDVRIIGVITIIALLGLALIGMEWEARAQLFLLGILMIAIVNFMIGTFIPPTEEKQVRGYHGYQATQFEANAGPDFRDGEGFFSVFSIFFPAATGILAGANISGDLRDAQSAIPKGTLLAILLSSIVYIIMAWMVGSCMDRDALGPIVASVLPGSEVNMTNVNGTLVAFVNATAQSYNITGTMAPGTAGDVNTTMTPINCKNTECIYGLMKDMQVMELVSGFGPLITVGIFAATLSSALASLVSAPKVFQAVCKDKIFPYIHVFAKGYGKAHEPRRAYLLAFVIGLCFILIGDLNAIAPLISNFFLMAYALINYSCFDASLVKSPGWRPAFRFYSMWLSLVGALICLGVMFVINWWTALITFVVVAALYMYVRHTKPDVNWGSSTQAHVYRNALTSTLKLVSVMEHVKNFRPNCLVLTADPSHRPSLVDFFSLVTRNISQMTCGHVIINDGDNLSSNRGRTAAAYDWLHKRKVKAFYVPFAAPTFRSGVQALLQAVGTGKLRPNTLIIGFKNDWVSDAPWRVEEYVRIIHDGFDMNFGVGCLRLKEGLDISEVLDAKMIEKAAEEDMVESTPLSSPRHSCPDLLELDEMESTAAGSAKKPKMRREYSGEDLLKGNSQAINKDMLRTVNRFLKKQKKGTIDVWWLFDDGGLTLLLPYILSQKAHWRNCDLRIFTAGTKESEIHSEQRNMATLLSKFRIQHSHMEIITTVGKKPHADSYREFKMLIEKWMMHEERGENKETHPWKINREELLAHKDKTYRHIRLRELLQEYSSNATLIVMTLPMPRKGVTPSGLYMAWIDTITKDMPPILLLRGNQESVLTYYS